MRCADALNAGDAGVQDAVLPRLADDAEPNTNSGWRGAEARGTAPNENAGTPGAAVVVEAGALELDAGAFAAVVIANASTRRRQRYGLDHFQRQTVLVRTEGEERAELGRSAKLSRSVERLRVADDLRELRELPPQLTAAGTSVI